VKLFVGFGTLFVVVLLIGSAIPTVAALSSSVTNAQAKPIFQFASAPMLAFLAFLAAFALIGGVAVWATSRAHWTW
jgi:hypothetical protein